MINQDRIAHDLAIAYVNNRYGAEVKGRFFVSTFNGDTTGSGEVVTERLPDADAIRMVRVGTGEKRFLGLFERTRQAESGDYEVDDVFNKMIEDYCSAYSRFLELLASR